MPYINIRPGQTVTVSITAKVTTIDSVYVTLELGLDSVIIPVDRAEVNITIDDEGNGWPVAIDPSDCGCTECLTGQYVPAALASVPDLLRLVRGEIENNTGRTVEQLIADIRVAS